MVAERRGRGPGPSTTARGFATKLDDVVETLPDLTERPAKPPRRPKRHPDLAPSHPGALLREIVLPGTGRPKVEIAKLLGVSRQTLYDVLSEKAAVTPQLAVRLGKMFGDGPEPWLRMQAAHDVWTVSRTLADEIAAIPTLAAAAE